MSRVYISVDIETDGVVAGRNNMLSLGAAAIDMSTGQIVGKFKRNLDLVPGHVVDTDTMNWWKQFPAAYLAARENSVHPAEAVQDFVDWVIRNITVGSVIFAWKPVMDLAFLRYYIHRFHPEGESLCIHGVFGRQGFGLDQKTVAALALGQAYRDTKMGTLPNSIRVDEQGNVIANHSHDALEDATEQALIFWNSVQRLGVEL